MLIISKSMYKIPILNIEKILYNKFFIIKIIIKIIINNLNI